MNEALSEKQLEVLWKHFSAEHSLSSAQEDAFRTYCDLLRSWNEKFNITAITIPRAIIKHHFSDSLILGNYLDMSTIKTTCDAGSGGGFPGIPLKIRYPHLKTVLIEVNKKKQSFLAELVKELNLDNVEICDLDWRTFLRTTEGEIDLFLSRASLETAELCRAFKPSCSYNNATVVYWAGRDFQADKWSSPFLKEEHSYTISHKKRKLVFFTKDGAKK